MKAYSTLKKALCSAPVLRHPNFDKEFILCTDASGYGLGEVLSQIFEDGEEHPIAYASRSMLNPEMRYASIEREALAVAWGAAYFEEYLAGNHFIIYTDHKPLLALMTKYQLNKRLERYSLKLAHLDFTIKYRPGKQNVVADWLSRYPVEPLRGKRTKAIQTDCNGEELPQPFRGDL